MTAKAGSTGTNQPASSTTSTSAVAAATPTPLPDRNAPTVRILTSFAEPFITAPTIDLTHALANPEESPVERANSRIFRVSIIGFCCIAVLAGVLAVLSQRMDTNERRQLVSEEAAVPVPTPTVSVQTMFTIAVQNGTGKAGEASRMAERLTGAGFSVGSIGNAPARETQTSLHVRPSDALRIDDLIASLSSIVTVSSHAADLGDGTESARLILGR